MKTSADVAGTFGGLLRHLRQTAGLSQEELAERTGLSRRGIADLERGARRSPYPATVRQLAAGLGADEAAYSTLQARALDVRNYVSERTALPPSLPIPPGPLVGRAHELSEVKRLLAHTRLLTLTGAGGSGKTRLALEVARAIAHLYPDGTALVMLASATGADRVLAAVADAVGVREKRTGSLLEQVSVHLRNRRMLLVLDNFEHVLDAAPLVAELLAACDHLALLATSREALHIREEQEFQVPPLALPSSSNLPVAALLQNPSVQLFAHHAARARPDFAVTPQNAAAIAAICLRLDGLPLALELAAARTRVLAPAQLLERLEYRLPLLVDGSRDLPVRQRTLRATIAWSYDLLEASDRHLFLRLALCNGGCTIEAAEALGASVASPDRPILDGLASLLEKNLVRREGNTDAEPRFTMLETMREFARDQAATDELESAQQAHAEYYLTWLATIDPSTLPLPEGGWIRRLDAEYENLRQAVRWCLDRHDVSLLVGAGTALTRYAIFRGYLAEFRAWWEEALELSRADPTTGPTLGFLLAIVLFLQGDQERVGPLLDDCLIHFRERHDLRGTAHVLLQLGMAAPLHGRAKAAVPLLREAESLFRQLEQHEDVGWTLLGLGNVAYLQADLEGAEGFYLQALAVVEQVDQPRSIAQALAVEAMLGLVWACLGSTALSRGDVAVAEVRLRRGVLASDRVSDATALGTCVVLLAGVALRERQVERAASLLGAAEGLCGAVASDLLPPHRIVYEHVSSALLHEMDERKFELARARAARLTQAEIVALALGSQADSHVNNAFKHLTPREREVAGLAARGFSNREIATQLVITEGTARVHVEHVLSKLDLHSRAQLAAWALAQSVTGDERDAATAGTWS